MTGQVNYEDNRLGQYIVNISGQDDVNTIVEVGTWNGLGTTRCVLYGLSLFKKENYKFISVECNREMYEQAIINNNSNINEKFNILYGKVVDENLISTWLDRSKLPTTHSFSEWLDLDIEWMSKAPNVFNLLPEKIDFLILDGGEFTTYLEWHALKDRVMYCAFDDTTAIKCAKIREEILASDDFEIIEDCLHVKNGFLVVKKKN
jgi:hypothetical protein